MKTCPRCQSTDIITTGHGYQCANCQNYVTFGDNSPPPSETITDILRDYKLHILEMCEDYLTEQELDYMAEITMMQKLYFLQHTRGEIWGLIMPLASKAIEERLTNYYKQKS